MMEKNSGRSSRWQRCFLWAIGGFSLFGSAFGLATLIAVYVVMNKFHVDALDRAVASRNPTAVAQVQALIADGRMMQLFLALLWFAAALLVALAFVLIRREARFGR
jgi:ABC-type lipoprotein release transport system permease subunit